MSVKEKTQIKNKRRFTHGQWLIKYTAVFFTIVSSILILFTIYGVNQYAGFSRRIFRLINWIVLIVLLLTYYLLWRVIVNRMKKTLKYLSYFLMLEFIIGLVGSILVFRVNSNVSKIINSNDQQTIQTSLVVENGSVSEVSQLSNMIIGITEHNLGTDDVQNKLKNVSNITYETYNTYSDVLTALNNQTIQAAILPKEYKGMFEDDESLKILVENTTSILDVDTTVNSSETNNGVDVTTTPFTVLIAGIDEERSDAIMVASFNPQTLRLTLSSIPRDSYVQIACYVDGQKGKLGHARATSRDCMISTVENILGINIDFYFESNFKGVVDIVDAIGGITINSDRTFMAQNSDSERGHYTVQIFEGENRLTGEQALAYARERHAYDDGDFSRQQNQQQVISAIMTEALRIRDLNTMLKVLDAAGDNVSTNFSIDQLTELFNLIMKKANRFSSSEHIEKIIDILNSRVSAYNSYYWDTNNYSVVSIVELYDSSIAAVSKMINDNLRIDSTIDSKTHQTFDMAAPFVQPTISKESYPDEEKVPQVDESYWCVYIGGGSWNKETSACTCYGGTSFEEGRGCVVTSSTSAPTPQSTSESESEATDNKEDSSKENNTASNQQKDSSAIQCNNNGGLYVYDKQSCVVKCPDRYNDDGNGGCKAQ